MRESIRFPLAIALICALAISLKKCPGPLPGWMPDDFPNKHRPREK